MKTEIRKDKILFTPGPLTTSKTVKQAMLRDLGSRDTEFIAIVQEIRQKLVEFGQANPDQYTTVLMQGSGTFGLEAVVSSTVPPDGKLLIIINGAYGKRLAKIASVLNIDTITLEYPENTIPNLQEIEDKLTTDNKITTVSVVHCETTTGIINPIREIGELVAKSGAKYFVDAMSSFGAVPINLSECNIDYLVSSANKCIEGVPGFSFVLSKLSSLMETTGYARTVSFNLLEQYQGLEKNGQFRFTPPTHTLAAFRQAIEELETEGGVKGRAERYRNNYETLIEGMRKMGFKEYLKPEIQGYIITSFLYPDDPNFSFEKFYESLNQKDYVIYPGKVSDADCFRIGNIGRISDADIKNLLVAITQTIDEMGVKLK
ncbi:MAG: 2-aminoethylphosphonate--pyruvate transaminase [Planctomycetes bacterium]|nr:2-aminoethylphosphonate--pyruvate transaminase [Planctomycetota bacterium]